MGDKACPALNTERNRKERCLERVGAIVPYWTEGIIWSSGVKFGTLWWIRDTQGNGVLNDIFTYAQKKKKRIISDNNSRKLT